MNNFEDTTSTVTGEADVVLVGRQAKSTLEKMGFADSAIEEVVLAVHELASNIVRHAGSGTITLRPLSDEDRCGVEIVARDSGPGIADVDRSTIDGVSSAGSLGGGLGTVYRSMDDVIINSSDDSETGVKVVAKRWDSGTSGRRNPPVEVGAATRAKPGQEKNGDAFLIEHGRGDSLVGVIDGLGHGEAAHRASNVAKRYLRTNASRSLEDLFKGVEHVCRDTRGVVMLLARFDWDAEKVTLGSVGNVSLRSCHESDSHHLVPRRGVLGSNAQPPHVQVWDWEETSVIVVHTDGISSKWSCDEFSLQQDEPVAHAANEMLESLSNREDDATVLVVRGVRE